jgi:raffinose/stachyose/melibiose transport system substrate-binding protein
MDRISRREFLALGAGAALAAAASCTPGTSSGPAKAPPKPANTGVLTKKPVTLTVWDQETGKVKAIWDELNKAFEQQNPNVTINRVNRGFGDLQTVLKLALSGPHPPDVVEANQGWPDMGQMVKAGLLLPLDNYADAYGWFDRVPENVSSVSSWTPDGKRFGTGNLFGFTAQGELIGVYYNKAKLQQLGLAVPTTFAAFEQALAAAKQAGEIPIQYGDLDKFPGAHTWAAVQERYVPESWMTDFIFGLKYDETRFDTPQNIQAATKLQEWVKNGYFAPDFLAVGYDDSVSYFTKGRGVFLLTGNWVVANLGAKSTEFGFFAVPPTEAGGVPVSTGAAGFPLSIPAKSENPEVAAAYIDWMTSDEAAQMLVQTGQIPLSKTFTPTGITEGTLLAQMLATAKKLNEQNGLVPYEDWATPSFYNTLTGGVQDLMGLKVTPQQFADAMQTDYESFQSSRTH